MLYAFFPYASGRTLNPCCSCTPTSQFFLEVAPAQVPVHKGEGSTLSSQCTTTQLHVGTSLSSRCRYQEEKVRYIPKNLPLSSIAHVGSGGTLARDSHGGVGPPRASCHRLRFSLSLSIWLTESILNQRGCELRRRRRRRRTHLLGYTATDTRSAPCSQILVSEYRSIIAETFLDALQIGSPPLSICSQRIIPATIRFHGYWRAVLR